MIKKNYQINKNILKTDNFILFYGINEGSKNEKINELINGIDKENIFRYDEKNILDNQNDFFDQLLTKSLFQNKKFIIIKRVTDKFFSVFNEIFTRKPENIIIIINAGPLDTRSKLRNFFEKDKKLICSPFYEDTFEMLSKLTQDFLRKNNISLSQSNINLLINRCSKDRGNLINELDKIKFFTIKGKKASTEDLLKLINLSENYSINELIDNCLAKKRSKTLNILNENVFDNNDCILIIRTFLSKAKKLLDLCKKFNETKDMDFVVNNYKPTIFWKDKEITKEQIEKWEPEKIREMIFKLNDIELQIKKNMGNSLNLISNFILDQSVSKTNSLI